MKKLIELDAANCFSWSDKGFAELFMAIFGEVLAFNPVKKSYMVYDGCRWRPDLEGMAARRCAKRFADALQSYAVSHSNLEDKQKSDFMRHSLKLLAAHTRETLIRDSRDLHVLENDSLDAGDYLLNCQNFTLDLSGPEVIIREHCAEDLISKVCAADYDAAADCPIWKKALGEIMEGDSEKVIYLQKILGLTLTGCVAEEEFYFLFGSSSRNGKSTVAETILGILGDYGEKISAETLAARAKDSRTASPDLAKLHGKRMVVASEPPKRMLFDSALVKSITGRDRITARFLHENEFSYIPKFKLFINTNFLPIVADETLFKSGRVRVISFNKHFGPEEQDRHLKDKLLEERSGILNWLLEGWRLYQKEGLLPPKSVVEATEEYAHDSDKLGRFVEDCLIPSEGDLPASLVYEAYSDWCEAAGLRAEGRNNFYSDLKSRGLFRASGTIRGKTVRNIVPGYGLAEGDFKEVEDGPF